MPSRRTAILVGTAGLVALPALLLLLAARRPGAIPVVEARAPVVEAAAPEEAGLDRRPVEQWTARIRLLQVGEKWEQLERELAAVRGQRADLDARFELRYLHGRTRASAGDEDGARALLAPYAAGSHPLGGLALYHLARAAQADGDEQEAARLRERLIFGQVEGAYRDRAVTDQLAFLSARDDPAALLAFADRLGGSVSAGTRRQIQARAVEGMIARDEREAARTRGLALLRERETDDSALRVFRALDRPELLAGMAPADVRTLGETARHHRQFDRAAALLGRALEGMAAGRDEQLFALGRAQFGGEDYAAAERSYLQGAAVAQDAESKANLLYHAARAALLQGQDGRAESYLTRALGTGIATPRASPRRRRGRRGPAEASPRAAIVLTTRLRLRLAARRYEDAQADLREVRRLFPGGTGWVDATVAYAAAMVGAGRDADALAALRAVPAPLTDAGQGAEADYWAGRARERRDPEGAVAAYLRVLRAEVPTHFAHLARSRVHAGALARPASRLAVQRAGEADRRRAAGDAAGARAAQTDALLLAPPGTEGEALEALRRLYAEQPVYRDVLELKPYQLPALPVQPPTSALPAAEPAPAEAMAVRRFDLLLALGLFDDAAELVAQRYPLSPPASALTRALVLHEAGVTRRSIHAVEILMTEVPDDYRPQLLPPVLRRLLYPRDYYALILEDARQHRADPRLVLAIMREESRFDPRARSVSSARGLLQFILGTARQVGSQLGLVEVSPEDLYEPRIVIRLGAKHLGDLTADFDGNPYRVAAAYNAGPVQARLWTRMAAGPADDAFLTAINFDETKRYVGKVMNSYQRYGEIYGGAAGLADLPGGRQAARAPRPEPGNGQ